MNNLIKNYKYFNMHLVMFKKIYMNQEHQQNNYHVIQVLNNYQILLIL